MTAAIDSREQADWLASIRLDPLEEDRADVRHAHLMSLLMKFITGKYVAPDVFLGELPWRAAPPVERPKPVALRSKIDAVMTMLGGKR